MLHFIRLGSERGLVERAWWRRLACRALGHRGFGYAVKLWALERLLRRLPQARVGSVLDFGCGDGMYSFYLARRFKNAQITGLDGDPQAVRVARRMAESRNDVERRVRFVAGRFEDFPATRAWGSYDLIVCLDCRPLLRPWDWSTWPGSAAELAPRRAHLVVLLPARCERYYGDDFSYYTGPVDVAPAGSRFIEPESTRAAIEFATGCLIIRDEVHYPGRLAAAVIRMAASQRRWPAAIGLPRRHVAADMAVPSRRNPQRSDPLHDPRAEAGHRMSDPWKSLRLEAKPVGRPRGGLARAAAAVAGRARSTGQHPNYHVLSGAERRVATAERRRTAVRGCALSGFPVSRARRWLWRGALQAARLRPGQLVPGAPQRRPDRRRRTAGARPGGVRPRRAGRIRKHYRAERRQPLASAVSMRCATRR